MRTRAPRGGSGSLSQGPLSLTAMHRWELASTEGADGQLHLFLVKENRRRHPEMLKPVGKFLAVFILESVQLEWKPGNVFLLFSICMGFPEN